MFNRRQPVDEELTALRSLGRELMRRHTAAVAEIDRALCAVDPRSTLADVLLDMRNALRGPR